MDDDDDSAEALARGEEYGEDGVGLMALADSLPGSFKARTVGNVITYTRVEPGGRTYRATSRLLRPGEAPDALPPLEWVEIEPE